LKVKPDKSILRKYSGLYKRNAAGKRTRPTKLSSLNTF